jgi:tryptophanyl-tRNA synthetase
MEQTKSTRPVVLTGIKPTGEVHLGNYIGAIRPAIKLAQNYEAHYFIADYHALNSVHNANELKHFSYNLIATWLACGLKTDSVLFYRQSDITQTFELATILAAFTAKGLLNRAHAYKAASDANIAQGQSADHRINMGLYSYPLLMAADILLFDTQLVPVGYDQKQHIEIAQDIAESFNNHYQSNVFVIPQPYCEAGELKLPGTDGRKMSKSYNNVIPLFAESKRLKKLINGIITNSKTVDEVKEPETIYQLYSLFATNKQSEALLARYKLGGMGWGEAKLALYEVIEAEIAPKRTEYNRLLTDTGYLDKVIKDGAHKAAPLAQATLSRVRKVIGIE